MNILIIMLLSFPSTYGSKGIYRTRSADVEWIEEARSVLTISLDGEGYRRDYTDSLNDFASGRVAICYTPLHRFEGYTMWRGHGEGELQQPFDQSDFTGDLGDLDIGAKYAFLKFNNSYMGGDLALTLPIGRGTYTNDGVIIYPKALFTYDFGDHWRVFPIRAHLNAGVPIGRQGLGDHFPVTFAGAFELPSRLFTYFMEISYMHERDWDMRFTPGLKLHPIHRVCITVAADLGLNDDYWLVGGNVGLSVSSVLVRERETRPTGTLAGEVRDRTTSDPVAANITLVELDESVASTKKYGVYKFYGVPKGVYTLLVQAPGYKSESRMVVVERGKTAANDFTLERSLVEFKGVVVNANSEMPIANASIHIEGDVTVTALTDGDGMFTEMLKPGVYVVKVNKKDFAQNVQEIVMLTDHADTITLKPIADVGETPEAIVYFDVDDANIRDDQKEKLDELAEFLKTHPSVNCELRGHTDPSGNIDYNEILSLARANSVKDYFVKVHGIEKNRLSTLAYSRTKLVKESPEKSRRVEIFFIK